MKTIEFQTTVDEQGRLTVPVQLLLEIGLAAGDTVKLACTRNPGGSKCSTFNEFVLTANGIATLEKEASAELTLPHELLEAADIPADSDLEIICTNGAVVILEADLLDTLPDDLRELFDELGISPDTVREVMRNGGIAGGC